ncbi:MAG: hypothetical protein KJ950_04180 [Proteobacteria bacterium]|nr:hypothetical protein [Pseudomonadota bacterium]MBU1688463.1 hypothetical protein [Pseudomonadota bacterium]
MTPKNKFKVCLILFFYVLGIGSIANAGGSPWTWLFSLKMVKVGDQMMMPTAVYVDEEKERYYVTDPIRSSLHSFEKNGTYLNTFNPYNKLLVPYDLVRDDEGIFWIVERGRNSFSKIDLKAKEIVTNSLERDGKKIFPDRIALNGNNFYILDKVSGDILEYDHSLKFSGSFQCKECQNGFVDFVIKDHSIWALDKPGKKVLRFNQNRELERTILLKGPLSFPVALEIDKSGLIYILDSHQANISVFDQSGVLKYDFLAKGHNLGRLYYPKDLLLDPWGRLCVVDSGNGRVEVFSR